MVPNENRTYIRRNVTRMGQLPCHTVARIHQVGPTTDDQ